VTRFAEKRFTVGVGCEDRAIARKGEAEGLCQAVH